MRLLDLAQLTLASAGTRQAVSATALPCEAAVFSAPATNSGTIYIGSSSVSSTRYVKALTAGQSFQVGVNVSDQSDSSFVDLATVNWDGSTTGDKLNVGYLARE